MNWKAQDQAMAELDGWSQIEDRSGRMGFEGSHGHGYPPSGAIVNRKEPIPRYHTDRASILRVFAKLDQAGRIATIHELLGVGVALRHQASGASPFDLDDVCSLVASLDKAPEQWVEAILRAAGKWD